MEHCVAVLKLCHTLTDKLAKIPLNSISPQLNDVICQATARVVPRFDDLLQSMAAPNVDVRLIEARVVALVTTCWSLVSPFYLMNPKYKEVFGQLINDMEVHQRFLQLAVDQATINATTGVAAAPGGSGGASPPTSTAAAPGTGAGGAGKTPTEQRKIITINETATTKSPATAPTTTPATTKPPPPTTGPGGKVGVGGRPTPPEQKRIINPVTQPLSVTTTNSRTPSGHAGATSQPTNTSSTTAPRGASLHPGRDEARQELLSDEAPADPSA